MAITENEFQQIKKFSEKEVATILTYYIHKGFSQEEIANVMDVNSSRIVSAIVRAYNFNLQKTEAYESGVDRRKYSNVDLILIEKFVAKVYPGFIDDTSYTFKDFLKEHQSTKAKIQQPVQQSLVKQKPTTIKLEQTPPNTSHYSQPTSKSSVSPSFELTPGVIGIVLAIALLVFGGPKLLSWSTSSVSAIFDTVTFSMTKSEVSKVSYDDGIYIGEVDNDKPEGYGRLLVNDEMYIGSFENGKLTNSGVLMNEKFEWTYIGSFNKNRFHGLGSLKNDDGSIYIGEFKKGRKHGLGAEYLLGEKVYLNEYKKDKTKEQVATIDLSSNTVLLHDNDHYEQYSLSEQRFIIGERGDKFNGYALEVTETEVAIVSFKNDKREGYLLRLFSNGNVEFGDREKDDMENAIKVGKDSVIIGTYKNRELQGVGLEYFTNGDLYVGAYKHSNRHGYGAYYYANGSSRQLKYKEGTIAE